MSIYKIFQLYLQFIVFEIYHFFTDLKKLINFGILNYARFYLLGGRITFKNKLINQYLKKNYSKWQKLRVNENSNDKNKIIVTGFVHIPIYYMMNALFGKFLEEKFNSNVFCLLEKRDYLGYSIFKSFNFKNFIFLKKGNFFYRIYVFTKAMRIISSFKTIDDFLKFKKDKIYFGKIVYDHYLRHTGNCSTSINDFKIYYFLTESLIIHKQIKKNFKNKSFSFAVQSEHQFIPSAVCFQNFLSNHMKVFARSKGPKWITISSFKGVKDFYTPRDKIDFKILNSIKKKYINKISEMGSKIVKNRILGKDDFSLKAWGIKIKKNKDLSLSGLKKKYHWNENYPIVCIFGHLFVDGNYSNGWRVHKDNFSWLISTLNIIKDIKDVYWIVKPHPLEKYYNTLTSTELEVKIFSKKYNHIRLADKNVSNVFLKKNISAVVSSHGTAPLEYASFGIPSIVCANTRYSKLGFLNTATNQKEYKNLLKKIKKLKRLSKDNVTKANVFSYLAGKLVLADSEIIPDTLTGQDKLNAYVNPNFWKEAIKKIDRYSYYQSDLRKLFNNQLDKKQENILNEKFLKSDLSIKLSKFLY